MREKTKIEGFSKIKSEATKILSHSAFSAPLREKKQKSKTFQKLKVNVA